MLCPICDYDPGNIRVDQNSTAQNGSADHIWVGPVCILKNTCFITNGPGPYVTFNIKNRF